MFWKFDLNATSQVEKLLDKEDVTLQELMEEEELLQECKAQNRRLVDFLCQPSCMEELVTLITHEPPLELDEKVRFRYPNTACELLTSDLPQINDQLGGDERLLNLLYGFLDQAPPLNPLLASFVSKTLGNLIARKTEQVISFLRTKPQFIDLVLKHIDTSAMMDLLLRLISCVEPAQLRQEVLHWLNEEKVIQRLIALICPDQDEERQSNASQTLCDLIRLSRDQSSQLQEAPEPDPLLAALESQECVEQLLRNMFDGERTESCIVNGTQALLTLLEPRRIGSKCLAAPPNSLKIWISPENKLSDMSDNFQNVMDRHLLGWGGGGNHPTCSQPLDPLERAPARLATCVEGGGQRGLSLHRNSGPPATPAPCPGQPMHLHPKGRLSAQHPEPLTPTLTPPSPCRGAQP